MSTRAIVRHAKRRDTYLMPIVDRALELAELRFPDVATREMLQHIARDPVGVAEFLGMDAGTVPFQRKQALRVKCPESLGIP
jgi:hypothetical protein